MTSGSAALGRLISVVQDNRVERSVGNRVPVVWNPTPGAVSAVPHAMPLLQRVRQVDIVVVGDGGGRFVTEPDSGIRRYLAHHGVEVSVTHVSPWAFIRNEVMRSAATECGFDLLCMGVWGHCRLRRFVLGSVTQGVMRHMNLPTFIAA